MNVPFKFIFPTIFLAALLVGCAGMYPDYDPPVVNIMSFKSLPKEGAGPRFEIGLHVINPNRSSLKLQGLAYSLQLEGYEVLTGVTNELPEIMAYGEADVVVQASVDLLSSIRFITGLFNKPRDEFSYVLETKLDPGGLRPSIRVSKEGVIQLSGHKDRK